MYDPLIVETFGRVHAEISPTLSTAHGPPRAINEITGLTPRRGLAASPSPPDDFAASADEILTLSELARALAGQASVTHTGNIIAGHLRRLIPFALSVLYVYDDAHDDLVAKHAMGDVGDLTTELRVPLGQRLSGWVAANRATIINSDPMLDFGEAARTCSPRLRNCLSTPLVSNDQLVGVLSLYSILSEGFSDDHRRIIEVVARQVSRALKSAAELDRNTRRDPLAASSRSLTGLFNAS
jgi:GAF domain-containing protein